MVNLKAPTTLNPSPSPKTRPPLNPKTLALKPETLPKTPSNLIKATQTLTPVRRVTDTRLFERAGGGGGWALLFGHRPEPPGSRRKDRNRRASDLA